MANVPDLIVEVASELGISKMAIVLCRVVYVSFGWLVNLLRKLFGSSEESLPEDYENLATDVKGIAELKSGPRNREKHALHGQLQKICAGWDGGTRAIWQIMRAIRKLPKNSPAVAVAGSTFRKWTESLNEVLGLELKPVGDGTDLPVASKALKAVDAAIRRHCKGVVGGS
jgi:hypothetical protein